MQRISAIVVTYNSEQVIGRCLASLRDAAAVIVVDNASTDQTSAAVISDGSATLVQNPSNLGFAAAANQGAAASQSPYLLFCNPDVEILDGLDLLVTRTEEYGAAAGLLVSEDGTAQAGFSIRRFPTAATLSFEVLGINRLWPNNPINRRYRYLDGDLGKSGFVEQPAGAFLMFRKDVFEELGGFDEDFCPIWFEDVDLCRRFAEIGGRIWYESGVRARHTGAHSVGRLSRPDREIYWYGSLLRYAGKYLRDPAHAIVCISCFGGAVLRMLAGIAGERKGKPLSTYTSVARMALVALAAPAPPKPKEMLKRGGRNAGPLHPAGLNDDSAADGR